MLNNVLYVPGMGKNHLSLPLYNRRYKTSIKPGHGVNVTKNGALVAEGVRHCGGLFKLKTAIRAPVASAVTATTVKKEDVNVWHQRMGHLSENNVRKVEALSEEIKSTTIHLSASANLARRAINIANRSM